MLFSVLLTLASPLAAAAIALPGFRRDACPISSAAIPNLDGQLTVPYGLHPVSIALGVGTQNYTCTNGKYTYVSRSIPITRLKVVNKHLTLTFMYLLTML
jgi:hypothetical protein